MQTVKCMECAACICTNDELSKNTERTHFTWSTIVPQPLHHCTDACACKATIESESHRVNIVAAATALHSIHITLATRLRYTIMYIFHAHLCVLWYSGCTKEYIHSGEDILHCQLPRFYDCVREPHIKWWVHSGRSSVDSPYFLLHNFHSKSTYFYNVHKCLNFIRCFFLHYSTRTTLWVRTRNIVETFLLVFVCKLSEKCFSQRFLLVLFYCVAWNGVQNGE